MRLGQNSPVIASKMHGNGAKQCAKGKKNEICFDPELVGTRSDEVAQNVVSESEIKNFGSNSR